MEPFSISCTTCQAKLRVRDPSAIGQILTCPKCGSMVLIEAPVERAPVERASGERHGPGEMRDDSVTGGAPQNPTPASPPAPATPRPPKLPVSNRPNVHFADTVDDPTQYGMREPSPDEDHEAPSRFLAAEPISSAVFSPTPTGSETEGGTEMGPESDVDRLATEWVSERSRQRRRWLAVAIAAVGGVALAIAVFSLLASRSNSPVETSPVAQVPTTEFPGPGDPAASAPPAPTAPITESPVPGSPGPENPEPAPTSVEPPNPSTAAPTADSPSPAVPPSPAAPPSQAVPPMPPATAVAEMPPERSPTGPAEKSPGKEGGEKPPLPAGTDPRNADRMLPGGPLSQTLRQLGGLIGDEDEMPADTATPPPAGPPAIQEPTGLPGSPPPPPTAGPQPDAATTGVAREGDAPEGVAAESPASEKTLERPPPREVDLESRLADAMAEIELSSVPLGDAVQFIIDFSTIPVTIDPDALVWSKMTPDSPISIKASDTSVSQLLAAVADKAGVVVVPVERQILLTRPPTVRKAARRVDDLMGAEGAGGEALAGLVTRFIAPESWTAGGGTGTVSFATDSLGLEQTDPVLLEVSAFLERLRVARGLPIRSKFDPAQFATATRTARMAPALAKPLTLNFSRPTSFAAVVRRVSRESGVPMVINWIRLADAGWNPDAEVRWTVAGQPLSAALESLLTPMELTYRIADGGSLQITTPADMAARRETEFYPCADLLGPDGDPAPLLEKLRTASPAEWWQPPLAGDVAWDAPSRALIVRLPQRQQQAIEQLLTTWRDATPTTAISK